jgi:serine/threonine protein kinase
MHDDGKIPNAADAADMQADTKTEASSGDTGAAKQSVLDAFDPGELLEAVSGSKYRIDRVIGEGGMGVIYEAKDLNCRRQVAMKVLNLGTDLKKEDVLRFIEEGQVSSQLEHPNIVPIHDMGLDDEGNLFYTMKYVHGVTLTDVLLEIRRGNEETIHAYPLARLLTIFQKVCDAVAFAHSRGVIHRDLKPDNVMIGDYGEVLVMDWGLAKVLECAEVSTAATGLIGPEVQKAPGRQIESIRKKEGSTTLRTMSGRVMGTPGFMAPEQATLRGRAVDERADVYSLGAILYSLLVLRPPVTGKEVPKLLKQIAEGDFISPAAFEQQGKGSRQMERRHLPDGEIPAALSDMAMKALATDPDERYGTVRDLQADIEAFQNGRVWHLVLDEDFTDEQVLENWDVIGGNWSIEDGELRVYGGEPQILLLKQGLAGDACIEFECRQESVYLNDAGCFLSAVRSENKKEIPSSGYEFKYGGYDNSLNVLMRSDLKIWSERSSPLKRGKTYVVRAERIGAQLRMVVNGEEIFRVRDPDPLSGSERTAVGLLGWMADTRYRHIRVYTLGAPWHGDILDTAERQLQKGHYGTAMDLFEEVMESFPDAERMRKARKGFETSRNREFMQEHLPSWEDHLREAWPGIPFDIRMDNDGLTVEVSNAGITDLLPLLGMPLTSLYCDGNEITDLSPLAGMPLQRLEISDNPIEDLGPLSESPLVTLLCESCLIRSLEPVARSTLSMINCGGNPLEDGIRPLARCKLTWLACWGTGIDNLEPVRGMPLTALYADANEIADLSPLQHMPLNTLHCTGNIIADLAPLAESRITALHCADNRIATLEPIRYLPLTMFSCHGNFINDLSPLIGMPLGALLCGLNPLHDLDGFEENPPESFLFDTETIPDDVLERVLHEWLQDGGNETQAQQVAVLLAIRRGRTDSLYEMAFEFEGHRYLFIPKFMTWDEAHAFAAALGAHLLTVSGRSENEFVSSLFPGGSWFWIGLQTTVDGHEWVTGEPFVYDAFVDNLRRRRLGPKVFFNGTWSSDVYTKARNCFMIEWDE